VPLSFIFRDTTIAHRRPINDPEVVPKAREQVLLMLDGQRIDLVRNKEATAWVARTDGPQIEVRDLGGGSMVMYDGEGRAYSFSSQGATTNSTLIDGNLYLLRDITGPGGNKVHLEYSIGSPTLPTDHFNVNATALSIDLARVDYNPNPTTVNCYKNQIILNYDLAPTPPPNEPPPPALSMSVLGSTVLARVHKLTTIDVSSRPTCAANGVALRTYQLHYHSDADTDQPQLQSVTMIGQEGMPERDVTLPVATYTYGTATNAAGGLTYRKTQSLPLPLPSGVDTSSIASSFSDPAGEPPPAPEYSQAHGSVTWQNLIDINGDGRPDLTFTQGGHLFAAHNIPGFRVPGNGGPVAFIGSLQLTGGPGSPLTAGALEMRSAQEARSPLPGGYVFNTDMVWRQAIDVNGDGRLDLIDAREQPGSWVVYLNTPDPTDPSLITWVRRSISIAPLVKHLKDAGYSVSSDYLPLSQRKTGATVHHRTCWQWRDGPTGPHWVKDNGGFATGACFGYPEEVFDVEPEDTFVEWQVRDINGDGYPDFVFDSDPVVANNVDPEPCVVCQANIGEYRGSVREESLGFQPQHALTINAMFNVVGMQIDIHTNAFSSPVAILPAGSCSVEEWRLASEVCGFADINGDGLPDRVSNGSVFLNTGDLSGNFFTPRGLIELPGRLAIHSVPQYQSCPTPVPQTYVSSEDQGFRDLNGDGIPDFIVSLPNGWSVQFGTGTHFSTARVIDVPDGQFALSQETENCFGTRSSTTRGLYDIDGDGQPEVVALTEGRIEIYQLNGTFQWGAGNQPSTPTSGRLVKIANGYGAVTTIGYRSAKEDYITWHQVPFPEIVVAAVGTADESGAALESPTLYAYGNSGLNYDPKSDSFVFPGYQRRVELRITSDQVVPPPTDGVATITETYPLTPFDESMDSNARFTRYLKAGHVSDVTTISGNVGVDPWAHLETNTNTDPRRISGSHYDWDTRVLATGQSVGESCLDMVYPYDYHRSRDFVLNHLDANSDQCMVHGFAFEKSALSWRGSPGTASPQSTDRAVLNFSEVQSVDDFGRVLGAAAMERFGSAR
jgi:hypothetical protein